MMTRLPIHGVRILVALIVGGLSSPHAARAQSAHDPQGETAARAPRVRLDLNPRMVQYQLRRLSTDQLLKIPRSPTDARYLPVYREILIRGGIAQQQREASLAIAQTLSGRSKAEILIESISEADIRQPESADPLTQLFLRLPDLADQLPMLESRTSDARPSVRTAVRLAQAHVHGITSTWKRIEDRGQIDLLSGVSSLDPPQQEALLPLLATGLAGDQWSEELEAAAMRALSQITSEPEQRLKLAVQGMGSPHTRSAAIAVMGSISPSECSAATARSALAALYREAEQTPPPRRADQEFIHLMESAGNLAATLPEEESRDWRTRLAKVAIRVIRIQTVFDQMRYDKPFFVVEQAEEFLLVFGNRDMMPHNLVITAPGALREIGLAASALLPTSPTARQYVPDSPKILAATEMLLPNAETRLTLTAPSTAGEYPFVCTFPNHWYRMYGVMLVVPDLAKWQQHPRLPSDPLGIKRRFIRHWGVDDIAPLLAAMGSADEATVQQGAAIFTEAGCIKCHRIHCQGSVVGPALDGVLKRHQGELSSVLREIVDPSYAIADQYTNYSLELRNGGIVSGLIVDQTDKSVTVISNPEDPQAVKLRRTEIEQVVRLGVSLMPSGLLDQYTQDEIRSVLAFLQRAEDAVPETAEGR